jgi:hypothetical protein
VCLEHWRVLTFNREADELLDTLQEIGEYWQAAVKAYAADLAAIQGPDEDPLTREQAQRLAEPWLRCDALVDAQAVLEDLKDVPEEVFGARSRRWVLIAAIAAASTEAGAEQQRLRRR